jgi:hypothetical protein
LIAIDRETCTIDMPYEPTNFQSTVVKPYRTEESDINEENNSDVPILADEVSILTDEVLILTDEVPILTDEVPILTDEVPILTDEVPILTDKVPTPTDEVPIGEELSNWSQDKQQGSQEVCWSGC